MGACAALRHDSRRIDWLPVAWNYGAVDDHVEAPELQALRRAYRFRLGVFSAVGALVLGLETFQRANLADHIPTLLTIIGVILGYLLGLWLALAFYDLTEGSRRSPRQKIAMIAFPILCLFMGTFVARALFLQAAFVGLNPGTTVADVQVVNRSSRCGRRLFGNCRINVKLASGSREFRVLVSPELYRAIGPGRSVANQCLQLEVQGGRWGYRRVMAPNYFDEPLGLSSHLPC